MPKTTSTASSVWNGRGMMASSPAGIDPVPPSRQEKRIVELCSKAIQTDDLDEFRRAASELRAALKEQINRLRGTVDEACNNFTQPSQAASECLADRPPLDKPTSHCLGASAARFSSAVFGRVVERGSSTQTGPVFVARRVPTVISSRAKDADFGIE